MTEVADVGGFRVRRFGFGTNHILAVHGWGGGLTTFEPLQALVPSRFTLWAVELPGYGQTAPLSAPTLTNFSERAQHFVEAFEPKTFTLFGNCSGAIFGMLIAQQAKHRLDAMVLIDPFAYFPWYFKLLTTPIAGEFFYRSAFANPVGRFLTQRSVAKNRGDTADMTGSFESLRHDVVHAYLRMMRQIPSHETFADLQVPTTLLIGARTFDAVKDSVRLWGEIWPHQIVRELDAAHLPIQEATESVANAVFRRPE